jgi:chitinase
MQTRSFLLVLFVFLAASVAGQEPPATIKTMWTAGLPDGMPEFDGPPLKWAVAVELAAPLSSTVHIRVETVGGTATPGLDYEPFSEVLVFPPGQVFANTYIWVAGDVLDEDYETIVIRATQEGVVRWTHIATIADNDWSPNLFVLGDSADEPVWQTRVTFSVRLDRSTKAPVSVAYTTVDGTAVAGQDYHAASGTVVIPAGQGRADIEVVVIGDTEIEPDETFTLRLSNAEGAFLGGSSSASATIVNDDFPPPPFAISSGDPMAEGDSERTDVDVIVRLGSVSSSPVMVSVQTTGEGTATPGVDYEMLTETLTFAPGVTELVVRAKIIGDTVVEADENFVVAVLADGVVMTTVLIGIRDDDNNVAISIADVTVTETDAVPAQAVFDVTLSEPSAEPVRVRYRTAAETATVDSDFVRVSGELVFPAGVMRRSITVDIPGDLTKEATETFRVDLFGPAGARLADESGVGTIVDDDGGTRRRAARH